jgi:hypothetical protein
MELKRRHTSKMHPSIPEKFKQPEKKENKG